MWKLPLSAHIIVVALEASSWAQCKGGNLKRDKNV